MKSLSLQRPLALIVIGIPGSGKSYFARQFSEMFSAPLVSFDKIYHRLITKPTYKKEEMLIVQDIMSMQVEELGKTGKVFIVDTGYCNKTHRLLLQSNLKKQGYETIVIWVQTNAATSSLRSLKRKSNKIDDQYNHSLSKTQFEALCDKLTAPLPRESVVVISGKHTFSSQAKSVLQKIVTPRNPPVIQPKQRPLGQYSQARRNIVSS